MVITRFRVDFIPPAGADAEPFQCEFEDTTPAIRLPDIGERFAFIDQWGRRQSGVITAREDLGQAPGAPTHDTRLIAVTVQAVRR